MIKIISQALLFLLIAYILSSPCTEKTELLLGEDESTCESLLTEDNNTVTSCIFDKETKGCKEVTCNSLPYEECHKFHYDRGLKMCYPNPKKEKCELKICEDFNIDNCLAFRTNDNERRCLPNKNNTACQLQTCEELSNCSLFKTDNPHEMCLPITHVLGVNCLMKLCYQLTTDCGSFSHPDFPQYICDKEDPDLYFCSTRQRKCEEMDLDKCYLFIQNDINVKSKCMLNKEKTSCVQTFCENLNKNECSSFIMPYDSEEKCVPNGENCILKTCSDLSVEECPNLIFENNNYKCDASSGQCKMTKCSELEGDKCGDFIPNNPILKCAKDEVDGKCYIEERTCEELPVNMCDKIDFSPKKCVLSKDKKKCEWKHDEPIQNGTNGIKFYLVGLCLFAFIF
jgi:hypothetical protein